MNTSPARAFRALTGLEERTKIVDVGANPIDGRPPYAGLLAAGLAEVVGFEPNREALAQLDAAKGPHETYLPWAIGDGGRHTLHICECPGMTSLLRPNAAVLELFHGFPEWGSVLATEEVQTIRLDDVPETAGAELLKLDIQGAELMALRHAEARLATTLVVQAEVEFLELYEGQPLFAEVESHLRARGFLFHRFFPLSSRVVRPLLVDNCVYSGLSQALWADGLFIRDLTRLDALEDGALRRMAMLLHDCYGSLDIAYRLLAEHDRRRGGDLAGRYLEGLRALGTAPRRAA
jgi:FkbM family methyltransferase